MFFVGLSVYGDWKDKIASATDITMRSARVAQEHALKLFDMDAVLISRIVDALRDRDDAQVSREELTLHRLMLNLGGGYPQVSSILISVDRFTARVRASEWSRWVISWAL